MIHVLKFRPNVDLVVFVDETRVNMNDLFEIGIRNVVRVRGNVESALRIALENPDASFDYVAGAISEDV